MRQVLGLIVGLVVAVIVSTLIEFGAHAMLGTTAGTTQPLPAAMAAAVVIGWVVATFAGALAGNAIALRIWPGYVIAVLFVAAVVYTITQASHPAWVTLGGIVGPLAAAWIAARMTPLR